MSDPRRGSIYLTKEQLEYIVRILGHDDPRDAIEHFAILLLEEKVDPSQMGQYIEKLIQRENQAK